MVNITGCVRNTLFFKQFQQVCEQYLRVRCLSTIAAVLIILGLANSCMPHSIDMFFFFCPSVAMTSRRRKKNMFNTGKHCTNPKCRVQAHQYSYGELFRLLSQRFPSPSNGFPFSIANENRSICSRFDTNKQAFFVLIFFSICHWYAPWLVCLVRIFVLL